MSSPQINKSKNKATITIQGFEASGKTALITYLKGQDFSSTYQPTQGIVPTLIKIGEKAYIINDVAPQQYLNSKPSVERVIKSSDALLFTVNLEGVQDFNNCIDYIILDCFGSNKLLEYRKYDNLPILFKNYQSHEGICNFIEKDNGTSFMILCTKSDIKAGELTNEIITKYLSNLSNLLVNESKGKLINVLNEFPFTSALKGENITKYIEILANNAEKVHDERLLKIIRESRNKQGGVYKAGSTSRWD